MQVSQVQFAYVAVEDAWGPCNVTCGLGVQTRPVACVDDAGAEVDPGNCYLALPPPATRDCYMGPCSVRSLSGRALSCCVCCVCVCVLAPPRTRYPTTTNLAGCWAQLAAPHLPWSVTCVLPPTQPNPTTPALASPSPSLTCPAAPPPHTHTHSHTLQGFEFYVGAWGSCSLPCGGGVQVRTVQCRNSSNVVVEDDRCPGGTPARSRACGSPVCPSPGAITAVVSAPKWAPTGVCDAGNVTVASVVR
jgi:hypothetical protein